MVKDKLQLNSDKTECLLFNVRNELKDNDREYLNIGHDVVTCIIKAKNLGVYGKRSKGETTKKKIKNGPILLCFGGNIKSYLYFV